MEFQTPCADHGLSLMTLAGDGVGLESRGGIGCCLLKVTDCDGADYGVGEEVGDAGGVLD